MPDAAQNCAYHSDNVIAATNALQKNTLMKLTNPLKDHVLWASLQTMVNQKIQQLQGAQKITTDRDNARKSLGISEASLKSTKVQLTASQVKVSQLESSVQKVAADILQANERVKAVELQNTQFKAEYDEMKRQYEEIQASVSGREEAFVDLQKENTGLKAQSGVIISEVENARRGLAKIKAEKAKVTQLQDKEIQDLQGVIDKLAHVSASQAGE
ncbi:MAG: chromosome segregation ATPase [Chlamydiales bacterium]|jgi:chromosome segregation ATPase